MGFRITVDVFSGRPNPSWEIRDPQQVTDLRGLFHEQRPALAPPGTGAVLLGFRGLRVEATDSVTAQGLPPVFTVGGPGSPPASAELAEALLDTMPVEAPPPGEQAPAVLTPEFRELVRSEIRSARTWPPAEPTERPPADGADCPYDVTSDGADLWNNSTVCPHNNCYNYAVNDRTDTFAQPGRAHQYDLTKVTCADVLTGALKDGLRSWGVNCYTAGTKRYKVALVTGAFGTQRDFHWYRLCTDNTWWHKPGACPITNLDNAGKIIADPQKANRGNYTDWCTYMQSGDSVIID
ncbi:hypothetical protein [Kitasatospora sp. NPDC018619]|uniref:hypothetical protein n=1 Tax=unclassified Kitasatospora TaxID=2633591 RepID=UPI0037A7043F